MRLLKETIELKTDTEIQAKEVIEEYRAQAHGKGYTLSSAGYTYKTKKKGGEIYDEGYLVKIVQTFSGFWEE